MDHKGREVGGHALSVVTGLLSGFLLGAYSAIALDPLRLPQPPAQKGKGRHNCQASLLELPVTPQATLLSRVGKQHSHNSVKGNGAASVYYLSVTS